MKHTKRDQDELNGLLLESGLAAYADAAGPLLEYLDEIIEANTVTNLTRIDSIQAGLRLHLVDSLLAAEVVSASPPGTLLDIGTGGGFPGVPLCIATGREGILLDSVAKKSRAVNCALAVVGLAGLIRSLPERAEEHAATRQAEYAVVTARAVAPLPSLLELAQPLLCQGGRLVALKGAPDDDEILRGDKVAAMVGMRRTSTDHRLLPRGGERRAIIVYERTGDSRASLPRRTGLAQTSPLA